MRKKLLKQGRSSSTSTTPRPASMAVEVRERASRGRDEGKGREGRGMDRVKWEREKGERKTCDVAKANVDILCDKLPIGTSYIHQSIDGGTHAVCQCQLLPAH